MIRHSVLLLALLLPLANAGTLACSSNDSDESGAGSLSLSPDSGTLLPGVQQVLRAEGLAGSDLVWSVDGGELYEDGATATFVAPAEPGEYEVSVRSRSNPDAKALARLKVMALEPSELTREDVEELAAVAGERGRVRFEAVPEGELGARARFTLVSDESATGLRAAAEGAAEQTTGAAYEEIEVRIIDEKHGELSFGGVTIDGYGALDESQKAALRALASSSLFADAALVPLDLACTGELVAPKVMASLLMPIQAVQKYLVADRARLATSLAESSACRYFTPLDAPSKDERPAPDLPLLSNGQVVPATFGYLPFDDEGEVVSLAMSTKKSALDPGAGERGLAPDVNVFGPGGSMCRGACGADCEENNCGEKREEWRCVQEDGRNTGYKQLWVSYTCGEHEGCVEHDECFDNCKAQFGVGSWDAGFCMRGCDLQAASGYGALQGIDWAQGYGPFENEQTYDYSYGEPERDEKLCPKDLGLIANPGSGIAPHETVLSWSGSGSVASDSTCELDFGDGSEPVTIDPCPVSGERAHTYAVPSDLRSATTLYTATLTRLDTGTTVSTDVQASWLFQADPASGQAPLETTLTWTGFSGVEKQLDCEIDYGDGETEIVYDCAKSDGVDHTYAEPGLYNAKITVHGEERTSTRSIAIEVDDGAAPTECDHVRDVTAWKATATFGYNISAADTALSVSHVASGEVQATLTKSNESDYHMSFWSLSPTGTVSIKEIANSLKPNAVNPQYEYIGSDTPLPPSSSADTGSNVLLAFNLEKCLYNVHFQMMVPVATRHGKDTGTGEMWVAAFQTPWRPIPSSLELSDGGAYSAHTEDFILSSDELIEYYAVWNSDLIDMLGEAGLSEAQVSWKVWPSEP